jgi:hypothetical protein
VESRTISSLCQWCVALSRFTYASDHVGDVEGSFVFFSSAKQRCGIFHFLKDVKKDVKVVDEREFIVDIQVLTTCSR